MTSSLGLSLCAILSHKGEEKCKTCESSHLSDQILLFHLKFCFVVNDVDNYFSQLLIILMNELLTNLNRQPLISLLIPVVLRFFFSFFLSACIVVIIL